MLNEMFIECFEGKFFILLECKYNSSCVWYLFMKICVLKNVYELILYFNVGLL